MQSNKVNNIFQAGYKTEYCSHAARLQFQFSQRQADAENFIRKALMYSKHDTAYIVLYPWASDRISNACRFNLLKATKILTAICISHINHHLN